MSYESELQAWGATADREIAALEADNLALMAERDDLQRQLDACLYPEPVPPKRRGMRVGCALGQEPGESLAAAYDRREVTWGVAPESVRLFNPGLPSVQSMLWKPAGTVVTSFKGSPTEIVAGKHDATLSAAFSVMTPGHRWSYWHEPEDDIERAAFSAEQWRAAFKYCVGVADSVGCPAKRGPILMGWTLDPRSKRTFTDYAIAGADFYGWDVYTNNDPTVIGDLYRKCRDASASVGASWMVAEAGLKDPNSYTAEQTAAFVTDATGIARTLGATHWLYFDVLYQGYDFRLNTEVEWAAMRDAINYAG